MITRDTIAQVRQRADIVAIVGESVKLVRKGRSHVGLCPFHKEKTPSFSVNAESGHFYCFGCHEKGNVFDYLCKLEGLSFPEAVRSIADRYGIAIEDTKADVGLTSNGSGRSAADSKHDLLAVNRIASAFFESQLRKHPSARVAQEELERRGLVSLSPTDQVADVCQAFRVGYAPAGWDALVLHLRANGVSTTAAETLGLVVPRKGSTGHYDFFRNRLMFAISDVRGGVVGFSGRALPDPQTGVVDKQSGKYINSPESPVFKKGDTLFGLFQARQAIRQENVAVLVEGNFDVVSLHARGFRNTVAPLGTSFTETQARIMRRYTAKVSLLYDGDAAGREAVRRCRSACGAAGLDACVASLPDGLDPDDFVRERGTGALERLLSQSRSLIEYLIDEVLDESFPRGNPNEQASRVHAVARLIRDEADPTVRLMAMAYADKNMMSRLSLTDPAIIGELRRKLRREAGVGAAVRASAPGFGAKRDMGLSNERSVGSSTLVGRGAVQRRGAECRGEQQISLDMLGCVVDFPQILDDPDVLGSLSVLEGDVVHAFRLAHGVRHQPKTEWDESFLAHLQPSIKHFVAMRLAVPRALDAAQARYELLCNAQKLKRLQLAQDHAQAVRDIRRAATHGNVDEENDLLLEAVRRQKERLGL